IPLKDIRRIKGSPPAINQGWITAFMTRYHHQIDRHYLVHPNRLQIPELLDTFYLRAENVIPANLPRNVAFEADFRPEEYLLQETIGEIGRLKESFRSFRMVIGYFPTWRDEGQDLFLGMR